MSRKPTAIRMSKKPESKGKAGTGANTKKSGDERNIRSPKALAPPFPEDQEDLFDQSPFMDTDDNQPPPNHLPSSTGRIRWASILVASLITLFSLVAGFWLKTTIEDFFAVNSGLGWLATALVVVAGVALLALILREIISVARLRKLSALRHETEQGLLGAKEAKPIIKSVVSLYSARDDMKWHLDALKEYDAEVLSDPDRLHLAERLLMRPLDSEAKRIIASSAKRISLITALNPSPVLDILFVGFQVLQMLRKVMALYGGKPALAGAIKLVRMVATHLAITGGLAVSDTILQQFIGKGLAGRLSAKLGEGTVNGIMATRIGLAAIDLCRPMPFAAIEKPSLSGFVGELFMGNRQQTP